MATPLHVLALVLATLDAVDAAALATALAGVLLRAHDDLLAMLERLVLQEHAEAVVGPVQQGARRLRAKAAPRAVIALAHHHLPHGEAGDEDGVVVEREVERDLLVRVVDEVAQLAAQALDLMCHIEPPLNRETTPLNLARQDKVVDLLRESPEPVGASVAWAPAELRLEAFGTVDMGLGGRTLHPGGVVRCHRRRACGLESSLLLVVLGLVAVARRRRCDRLSKRSGRCTHLGRAR